MSDSTRSELVHGQGSTKSRLLSPKPSRREFLSRASKAVAGLAATRVTGTSLIGGLENLVEANDSVKKDEEISQFAPSRTLPVQAENIQGRHAAFCLFPDLTQSEAEDLNDKVNGFVMEIVGQGEVPQLRLKADRYFKLVKGHAEQNGFMARNMMGIILTESRFNPIAESTAEAVGLCGLKRGVAQDYGLVVDDQNDQRFDPEKNIEVASKYMRENKRVYGDESLAMWIHHAGPGHGMDALSIQIGDPTFRVGDYGDAIERGDFKERERIEKLVGDYVRENKLNFYKLMKNEKVVSWVKSNRDLEDETLNYPYRVLAGAVILGYAKF